MKHGKDENHRPYACYCGQKFSRLSTITRHLSSRAVKSVMGIVGAGYSCPLCTKYDGENGFNRRDHLRQHLETLHKVESKGIEFLLGRPGHTAPTPAEAVNNAADAVAQNVLLPPGIGQVRNA
ncbi:hypothetical protein F4859DRAFT_478279 [Xylaria cf. heliscus]|nr:hypothetical protein F4859DRAFT_478279 [Xylaria cf. heliscus]